MGRQRNWTTLRVEQNGHHRLFQLGMQSYQTLEASAFTPFVKVLVLRNNLGFDQGDTVSTAGVAGWIVWFRGLTRVIPPAERANGSDGALAPVLRPSWLNEGDLVLLSISKEAFLFARAGGNRMVRTYHAIQKEMRREAR